MSENTAIEWAHHTFNPWSGCAKISAGCANCYAAAAPPSMRRGAAWGPSEERRPASEAYWAQPRKWDAAAQKAGERHRVFASSMADVFEDRDDLDPYRVRLFNLICATPNLDWLLLTKRPENMVRWWKGQEDEARANGNEAWWPSNAWAGTSVENQEAADERIPWLLQVPARVRFLSCEPLLGVVDLRRWLVPMNIGMGRCQPGCLDDTVIHWGGAEVCRRCKCPVGGSFEVPINWVIVGGESGHRARPMHPDWARGIRDQCVAAGVPFHFKQWGEWDPGLEGRYQPIKVGKKEAGRLLDGRIWDEVPR